MEKPKDGNEFFPMTTVNVGPLTDHDAIMLQMEWANLQTRDKFFTPPLGLTRKQAIDLVSLITRTLEKLDAFQATGENATRQ